VARKDRVPNPPKRQQGPQRRSASADPAVAARRRRSLLLVALGALAVVAAIGAIVLLSGGGDSGARAALDDAGCTYESFPGLLNAPDHSDVASLAAKPKWNSNPPTSGPHWGQPAVLGFYDSPVLLVQSTHNLEHGVVVIHYGPDVADSEVEALRAFYDEDPNGLLVAPLPANKDKITLSAWTAPDTATGTEDRGRGFLARCSGFDEDAFSAFLEEHRYQGPERIPPDNLAPGT
jgi:Protein of unknown function (DUF3105)